MFCLKVKKLDPGAKLPTAAHAGDLGCDLFALSDAVIPPRGQAGVRTGVSLEFPEGWGGIIKDRSSMAAGGIYTSAGVIDAGYRGEIIVLMRNENGAEFHIRAGDKIAQIIPQKAVDWEIVEEKQLSATARSAGGFGSTGSK